MAQNADFKSFVMFNLPTIADTPTCSAYVTWQNQDGVWNPMDRSTQVRQLSQWQHCKIQGLDNKKSASPLVEWWLEETHWPTSLEGQQILGQKVDVQRY